MKRVLLVLFSTILLCGCSLGNGPLTNEKDSIVLYSDSDIVQFKDSSLEIKGAYSNGFTANILGTASISIKNNTYETIRYNIKDTYVIKENTSAKYNVNCKSYISIDAELEKNIDFTFEIPSDLNKEKYQLYFTINTQMFQVNLYETPDELRPDRTVNYYIDGEIVKTQIVKHKRTISNIFVYDSSNHLSYCDTWYMTTTYSKLFSSSIKVTEDINLYGKLKDNIKFTTTNSDIYSFVSSINHIHRDGILYLPRMHQNKEIGIFNFAIRNLNVKSIYVPITCRLVFSSNFVNINNATIYYEGNEEQWKSIFYSSSDIVTKNVVYNKTISFD